MNFLDKVDSFSSYKKGWDSYKADPPSQLAMNKAKDIITFLLNNNFIPTRVNPSCIGGIAVARTIDLKEVFLEIHNNGKIYYMFANDKTEEIITGKLENIDVFLREAKEYLNEC